MRVRLLFPKNSGIIEWGPNGYYITHPLKKDSRSEIYAVRIKNGHTFKLTKFRECLGESKHLTIENHTWHKGGKSIVFEAWLSGDYDGIYEVDMSGNLWKFHTKETLKMPQSTTNGSSWHAPLLRKDPYETIQFWSGGQKRIYTRFIDTPSLEVPKPKTGRVIEVNADGRVYLKEYDVDGPSDGIEKLIGALGRDDRHTSTSFGMKHNPLRMFVGLCYYGTSKVIAYKNVPGLSTLQPDNIFQKKNSCDHVSVKISVIE